MAKQTYKKADEEKILDLRRELYKADIDTSVELQLQISAKVKLTGKVSGKQYVWPKAGAIVSVDERDVEELLTKKLGSNPCCGGSINWLFKKVE